VALRSVSKPFAQRGNDVSAGRIIAAGGSFFSVPILVEHDKMDAPVIEGVGSSRAHPTGPGRSTCCLSGACLFVALGKFVASATPSIGRMRGS